jgi:hypothetical protein
MNAGGEKPGVVYITVQLWTAEAGSLLARDIKSHGRVDDASQQTSYSTAGQNISLRARRAAKYPHIP